MGSASLFQVGHDVEFWRVLVHLSILAIFLVGFEAALHHLEHRLARYDKYHVMLQKVYRELMVLGLISLGLKILKEVAPINSYSIPMIAFQVADLIIFGLAIALILRSICIFLQLRRQSWRADQAELYTTQDLAQILQEQDNNDNALLPFSTTAFRMSCRKKHDDKIDESMVKHRLLRHLFLRQFGLPELFPFSKYICRAQANQISSMIEVEPSMWVLLLIVAWAICGLAELLDGVTLVKVLVVSSWILLLLHIVVMCYLRSCVRQLVDVAGYNKDKYVLGANITSVAEQENKAWENISANDAIEAMNQVLDLQEEAEHDRKLAAGIIANILGLVIGEYGHPQESGAPSGISIRFFSRRIWHVVVSFGMTLNGIFIALFVQCTLYNLNEIYRELGLAATIVVPLPLLFNTLILQQHMFSDLVLVCSILRIDINALGDVIRHFSETVELQSDFASSLVQCLKERGLAIEYFEAVIQSHDQTGSGCIEGDKLRAILASVGLNMTRFRMNSVANLLFKFRGISVEYTQLFQLLALIQEAHDTLEQHQKYPKIQRNAEVARHPWDK
ncbi:unnamed protein product [Phytophthora fragariaefolia]|uniref:Unnamed protein product n=1 Tax=Phytophthora fragariaefolia TaxID=1490495 RepID=A0A9W7D6N4_9STRA|nr:unnamed protein product [Phytophthora fragariaefolia]